MAQPSAKSNKKLPAKKSSKFGIGLALGAAAGAAAAALFSPRTGKQNRVALAKKAHELEKYLKDHDMDKKVKEIFGAATKDAKKTFVQARQDLLERVSEVDLSKGLDRRRFEGMVGDVVKNAQKTAKTPTVVVERLKKEFSSYFERLLSSSKKKVTQKAKQAKKTVKKAVKSASKSLSKKKK